MSSPWFRYHANVINSKRVQKLPDDLFKFWINCQSMLCLENVGASGKMPPAEDCAYLVRMSVEQLVHNYEKLVDAGLMVKRIETKCNENVTENETKSTVSSSKNETLFETEKYNYFLKNWGKKQYKSDSSTERVKRFRERSKDVTGNAPRSDQIRSDTDTDQRGSFHPENDKKKKVRQPGRTWDIERFIKDDEREAARRASPGWDQQELMRKFNAYIVGKVKEYPKHPGGAYIAWCGSFTKGKPPI